jgi:hypothetical protein
MLWVCRPRAVQLATTHTTAGTGVYLIGDSCAPGVDIGVMISEVATDKPEDDRFTLMNCTEDDTVLHIPSTGNPLYALNHFKGTSPADTHSLYHTPYTGFAPGPCVQVDKWKDGRLHVVSTAPIQHGDQLLMDYGPDATKLKV